MVKFTYRLKGGEIVTPYDLLDIIHLYYTDGDARETILEANELIAQICTDPIGFATKLENEVSDFAKNHGNLCPLCASDLVSNTYQEGREYFGSPCSETFTILECESPECAYTEE